MQKKSHRDREHRETCEVNEEEFERKAQEKIDKSHYGTKCFRKKLKKYSNGQDTVNPGLELVKKAGKKSIKKKCRKLVNEVDYLISFMLMRNAGRCFRNKEEDMFINELKSLDHRLARAKRALIDKL